MYGRRFTIEECFRDNKDLRFGFGLKQVKVGRTDRRDRLLFIAALCLALVTLLGALKQRNLKRGVASLCIGGGEATALAVEML